MDFRDYLITMVERDASDLYFSSGAPASAKVNGNLSPIEDCRLSAEQIRGIAYSIMNADQQREFEDKPEMNLAISESGVGRFRVNIFRQRNSISMVIRNIKTDIPDWELLGLPPVLTEVIMEKRGLILFVGATGSGKSVCINAIITCLVFNNPPEDLRLVMVDPKRVELSRFRGLPHLLSGVEHEAERVIGVFKWVTREMDERYKKFAEAGSRHIEDYNRKVKPRRERLPYIIVVIDELAGMLLSLWLIPLSGLGIAVGFLVFRLLDIVKPFPCRQAERLSGGLGIMTDDLIAGLYTNGILRLASLFLPSLLK